MSISNEVPVEISEEEESAASSISDVEMCSDLSDCEDQELPLSNVSDDSVNNDEVARDNDQGLNEKLRDWALRHQCTRRCVNEILGIFKDLNFEVPKDSRTLLNTLRVVNSTVMGFGNYVYIGIEKCINKLASFRDIHQDIELNINIDGLPIFKSSNLSLWPILIQFDCFQPIAIAFYCGRTKPPFDQFLNDFVAELNHLMENGIVISGQQRSVQVKCFSSDAPARSAMKGIVLHSGYHSCEKCTIKGVSANRRIVFDQEVDKFTRRDDATFRRNGYADKDADGRSHQLVLSSLLPLSIDLICDFALDPMHLVFLGVTRRLLYYVKGSYRHIKSGKLSSPFLAAISDQLTNLNGRFPSEFSRQPRGLNELDRWKATEFKSFLLYSGPVVLHEFLSPSSWKHFLSLSVAIRLLSEEDDQLRNENLETARKLLEYFVHNSHENYGETFCVYNIHGLVHLVDDVKHFQKSLLGFSCFPFENHLQKLKQCVRGKSNVLSQVVKRSEEMDGSYYVKPERSIKIDAGIKNSCFLTDSSVIFIKSVQRNGRIACDEYQKSVLSPFFQDFGINSKLLNIFLIAKRMKPTKCEKLRTELLQKCIAIPFKEDQVIMPMISNSLFF